MHARLPLAALAAALVLGFGTARTSQAYDGYGYGYGLGYGLGVGGLYNGLSSYSDYRVPYFAAHPPVYYSHPVARPYGFSPFAYPPHILTPEVTCAPSAPVMIENPYVPSSTKPAPSAEKSSDETVSAPAPSQPLVIMNPYVVDSTLVEANR
ncbi:hypothetical protein [Aeoliella sp. SH292]|uniref:hypothetical protein n=1 Tax=Aeoliella sp. SH292 TaxID=3454464 RepID=UPI003F95968C